MKEKNFLQKADLCIFAIFLLLALCLLPGFGLIKAYADENTSAEVHTAIDNPKYTLTATNGEHVATTANPGETTVLIFGHKGCSKTRSTLTSIASCNWVKRSDIRVIFADAEGNSQEDVLEQEEGYGCPEMIFCYDTVNGGLRMKEIMTAYKNLFPDTKSAYPFIVLIDKNNKVQNVLAGATKTSDEILNEIKKFEDIDETGSGSDSSASSSGKENYVYALKSIDGATVSTKARQNETTVLIFGYTTCGKTKSTLQSIDKSDWINRADIRVVYADDITMPATVSGSALSMVQEYAGNYTSGKIKFCYDYAERNHNIAFTYLSLYQLTGGEYPFIVYIDQNNKVQNITLGPKTADEIIAEIEKFTKGDQTTGGNGEDTSKPTNPDTSSPGSSSSGSSSSGSSSSGSSSSGSSTWNPATPGPTAPSPTTPDTTAPGTPNEPSVDTPPDPAPSVPPELTYEAVKLEDGSLQLKGSDGTVVKDQFVEASDGKQYYADENGVVAVNKVIKYDNVKYFAKEDGSVAHNELCMTEKGNTIFAQADGSLAVSKAVNVDGKRYYAKSTGALAKDGFYTTAKGNKIYAKKSGELITNQVFKIDGKRYCAKPSGTLVRNAFYTTPKGNRVYAKASGKLVTNKVFRVDGKRYCAKKTGALVKNAFYTLPSGKRIYAKVSGEIVENQIFDVRGKKYYADKNGKTTPVNG